MVIIMDNLEYLKGIRDKPFDGIKGVEARKALALEIIAEELCKLNKREDNRYSDKIEQVYVTSTSKEKIIEDIQSGLKKNKGGEK